MAIAKRDNPWVPVMGNLSSSLLSYLLEAREKQRNRSPRHRARFGRGAKPPLQNMRAAALQPHERLQSTS
jgi:hypothetical protein